MMKFLIHKGLSIILILFIIIVIYGENNDTVINQIKEEGIITDDYKSILNLVLALDIADYGRVHQRPMALILAGQIMRDNPVQHIKLQKNNEPMVEEEEKDKGEKRSIDTYESLFQEAMVMAKAQDNLMVLSLAEKESKIMSERGRSGGSKLHKDKILADDTDIYEIEFRGGEQAIVKINGDGDCNFKLYIYDENLNIIASDKRYGDTLQASWNPKWTGKYYIKIKNNCSVWAEYILITN